MLAWMDLEMTGLDATTDVIVEIAGAPVRQASDVSRLVRPNAGKTIPTVLERGGERVALSITPIANQVPELAPDGTPQRAADGAFVMTTAGYIGTSTGQNTVLQRQSITAVPAIVGDGVAQTAGCDPHSQRQVSVANRPTGPIRKGDEPRIAPGLCPETAN